MLGDFRINNYDKGKIKVLMLNAKYYGSGLNLQMTTDIIICHTMDENTKTQITISKLLISAFTISNCQQFNIKQQII